VVAIARPINPVIIAPSEGGGVLRKKKRLPVFSLPLGQRPANTTGEKETGIDLDTRRLE